MAPLKKGKKVVKKVVNQEELRRLMREKQRQSADKKRIESPFAKYNSLGHLSCVLCSVHVKSELLWSAHVLGKQHKEKVSELKGSKQTPQSQPVKRKAPDSEELNGKKAKPTQGAGQSTSGLPAGFFETPKETEPGPAPKSAGLSLLAGVYDEDEDEEEETVTDSVPGTSSGLPADFFDSSIPSAPAVSHSGSVLKADVPAEKQGKTEMAEALPEGFFDDPVTDAKVRNVDAPKDQLDKEWEEFQKELRLVNTKSDAIVAEDDEEGRFERQIDEIDEQIECYRRVELLRDKRDVVKSKLAPIKRQERMGSDVSMEEEDDDNDEEDEEELLDVLSRDWRAKGALV